MESFGGRNVIWRLSSVTAIEPTKLTFAAGSEKNPMTPTKRPEPPLPAMQDPLLCHYCNKNKLDTKDKYYLPNGIEVCQECAARYGTGMAKRQVGRRQVKR